MNKVEKELNLINLFFDYIEDSISCEVYSAVGINSYGLGTGLPRALRLLQCAFKHSFLSYLLNFFPDTVHTNIAGVSSVFPDKSIALTWNTCAPPVRLENICGLEHGENGAPSRLHSKVTAWISVPPNVNFIEVDPVLPPYARTFPVLPLSSRASSISVSGSVVSSICTKKNA